MAALVSSPTRASRTPGRSRREHSVSEAATEPPNKKRKYIPGGAGGGGRYINPDGQEQAVGGTGPGGYAFTAQRSRFGPLNLANGVEFPDEEVEGEAPTVTRSAMQTRPRRERPERYARQPITPRPRYSNSTANAAAASMASDGYKPREERSWEDFHPDLDIDAGLQIFTADEVDGRNGKKEKDFKSLLGQKLLNASGEAPSAINGDVQMEEAESAPEPAEIIVTPVKRKPGRPPRRPESMLSGLGSPPAPRIMPLPTHNPKERLNLPKPSFKQFNHFLQFEENQKENKMNYVDRTMASLGYQESDHFELPPKVLVRFVETGPMDDEAEVGLRLESDGPIEAAIGPPVIGKVEYDMDEQDVAWLEDINEQRKAEGVDAIKPAIFEITMTQIEKEYHALEKRIPKPQPRHAQMHRPRSSSQAAVNGDPNPPGDEPDSKCAICDDGDCENANAIIFCDGCDLAVHQECYGVPFIPEGQWFCRKCKEIGRGTPTCIFCPNVDGAFKQTSTLRWSHLLCAIWIPEVTIANMTFMEPITDVDKVPKGRWKLHCYICNQRMGACIQCGNKNCYLAFHVTCARKAKLFLKMKSQHHPGLDTTALKAFCDKHVPADWRRTHDTDNAVVEAKRWYRHAFKDRKWADSQTAAIELGAPPPPDGGLVSDTLNEDTIAVTKKRRNQPPKMSWRLPSGAPVVPAVVYTTVEASLARFTIRKRKEFVEKACRYWTLKREARRGAALLKRLQLQLESFSSMEITRRNFASMGAAGRPKLIRRIEFAEMLQDDMSHLTELCAQTREREELRMKEIELLRVLVDTIYFPVPALLGPILQRAMKLDERSRYFKDDFDHLSTQLRERYYTSVSEFSNAPLLAIGRRLLPPSEDNSSSESDIEAIQLLLSEAKPSSAEHQAMTQEQKEIKKLAKRILKAVKEPLEGATRKEAELRGRELEEELRKLDAMGIFASASKALELDGDAIESPIKTQRHLRSASDVSVAAGASPEDADVEMPDVDDNIIHLNVAGKEDTVPMPNKKSNQKRSTPSSSTPSTNGRSKRASTAAESVTDKPTEPLSPPISAGSNSAASNHISTDPADVFTTGGIPWYFEHFDITGTTVHVERYTGREVLREMSEELSDMDEDTLTELAGPGVGETPDEKGLSRRATRSSFGTAASDEVDSGRVDKRQKVAKKKGRRSQWTKPRAGRVR